MVALDAGHASLRQLMQGTIAPWPTVLGHEVLPLNPLVMWLAVLVAVVMMVMMVALTHLAALVVMGRVQLDHSLDHRI